MMKRRFAMWVRCGRENQHPRSMRCGASYLDGRASAGPYKRSGYSEVASAEDTSLIRTGTLQCKRTVAPRNRETNTFLRARIGRQNYVESWVGQCIFNRSSLK